MRNYAPIFFAIWAFVFIITGAQQACTAASTTDGTAAVSTAESSAAMGGSGGQPGTGGAGGTAGATPGTPVECWPGADYPIELLAFNPGAPAYGSIGPLPNEWPNGAAVGRFGPDAVISSVRSWIGCLGQSAACSLPDPLEYAVWTEAACGLPMQKPVWRSAPLAEFTMEPFGAYTCLRHFLEPPVSLGPQGFPETGFAALRLTAPSTCITGVSGGAEPSRALWLGRVDVNPPDGIDDAALGWATLAKPSSSNVDPIPNVDLALGAMP